MIVLAVDADIRLLPSLTSFTCLLIMVSAVRPCSSLESMSLFANSGAWVTIVRTASADVSTATKP